RLSSPAPCASCTLSLHDALPIFLITAHRSLVYIKGYNISPGKAADGNPVFLAGYGYISFAVDLQPLGSAKDTLVSSIKGNRVIIDRKSTRLNSSHDTISYAVSCL